MERIATALNESMRQAMYRNCLTMKEAAKKAGMPFGTFHGIVEGYHRPGKKAIVKIAKFLGVSREEAVRMRDDVTIAPSEEQ